MALNLAGQKPPEQTTPRRGRPPNARTAKAKAEQAEVRLAERTEGVEGLFQLAGAGLMFAGQHADGAACVKHGEPIATEAAKLAEKNDQVAKIIDMLCAAGPYAGLLTAVTPLVLQILVNHERIPAIGVAGVVPPDVLLQEVAAKAMNAQADMMEERARVEREAAVAAERLANAQDAVDKVNLDKNAA